mgnify:FL=1
MKKTRDKQYDDYTRESLAAEADSKTAIIAGFLAGSLVFATIIGVYLIILFLMSILGTFLSIPYLKEMTAKSSVTIGITGDIKGMWQGLLAYTMLFSMLGAFTGALNRLSKFITVGKVKFGKDIIPYFLLAFFVISAFFFNWLPQATFTIFTLSDNTGSVPIWGILLIIVGLAIPPTLLLYESWWYWYKKVIPFWSKSTETFKNSKGNGEETAN